MLTGFSTAQAKRRTRPQHVEKIDVPAALAAELEAQGVSLDWSVGTFGEERPFEAAIVCLGLSMSIHGVQNAASALWTLSLALKRGCPVVIFFDDWKISMMTKHLEYVKGHNALGPAGKRLWKYGEKVEEEVYTRVSENILEIVSTLLTRYPSNWSALFPRYHGWGDQTIAERLVPTDRFLSLDPTPMVINLDLHLKEEEQKPAWFLASLGDHAKWLAEEARPTWPVTSVGYLRGGQQRLANEVEVRREGASHLGILAPPYDLSGSGWFRSRFVYAALDGSVLHAGEADRAALGPAYQAATIPRVENGQGNELLAQAQAETILPLVATREVFIEEVKMIREALR